MLDDFKDVVEQSEKAKLLKKGKAVRVKNNIMPFHKTMHGTILKKGQKHILVKNQ